MVLGAMPPLAKVWQDPCGQFLRLVGNFLPPRTFDQLKFIEKPKIVRQHKELSVTFSQKFSGAFVKKFSDFVEKLLFRNAIKNKNSGI